MYAAYEALSDRMKTYLEGLTARHNGEHYRGQYTNYGVEDKESYPYADHPVVRTHPVTGRKALYVNKGFTRYINGIPRDESDGILRYLYEHMANPLFQCRFRWQRELDRVLGQSLRPAPRDVGLLAAHPLGQPGHGEGRPAGVISSVGRINPAKAGGHPSARSGQRDRRNTLRSSALRLRKPLRTATFPQDCRYLANVGDILRLIYINTV